MSKIAIVLDRDGTLIQHVPYLSVPDQVTLLTGVYEGLEQLMSKGAKLFMHTNQSGVGRGLFNLDAVYACNLRMIELLDLGRNPFERICIAPESPDQPSHYRKPSPSFANEIMRDYNLKPEEIWYVGDRSSDLLCAKAANTNAVGLLTGLDDLNLEVAEAGLSGVYPLFNRFDLAVAYILKSQTAP